MILEENRFGHIIAGRLFLANPGESKKKYVAELEAVYGTLEGVFIVKVYEGTELLPARGGGWQLPEPHCFRILPLSTNHVVAT